MTTFYKCKGCFQEFNQPVDSLVSFGKVCPYCECISYEPTWEAAELEMPKDEPIDRGCEE